MLMAMLGLEKEKLLKSSKMIVPVVILLAYLGFAYSVSPQKILSSFSLCSLIVYLIMLSTGVMFDELENLMLEQIQYVKAEYKRQLFQARILLMLLLAVAASLISLLYPVFVQICNQNRFFARPVIWPDLLSGFFLFFFCGATGGVLGLLLNQRIFKKRKLAVAVGIIIGILTIVRGELESKFFQVKFITWVFPPVCSLCRKFGMEETFHIKSTLSGWISIAVYLIVISIFYVKVMTWKKFE